MHIKKKDKKYKITFIIATSNEEKRIRNVITSILPHGKVLVVDNFSVDKTCNIAKILGAKVIQYKNNGWIDTKEEMDFIFSHVDTEWVCLISADEMIPKLCLSLYEKIASESKYKVVVQRKKTLLYQANTDFIFAYINIHFFRKGALNFNNNLIHERRFSSHVKPSEILYLPPLDEYSIYHFSIYTTEGLLKTLNIYSSFQAKLVSQRFIIVKLFLMPMISFFMHYFIGRLFTLGMRGFIISVQFALNEFLIYSKAYEIKNNINYNFIESSFKKEKTWLLTHSPKSNIFQKTWAYFIIFFVSRLHRWYKFRKRSRAFLKA